MISEKSPLTKLSYENIDISPEKSQSDSRISTRVDPSLDSL